MNIRSFVTAASFALLTATAGHAATLVSEFTFDAGLSDNEAGATATGAGTVSGGRYNFAVNEGLGVTLGSSLATYSIVFDVELDSTSGYKKLLDVSGLAADVGLYNLSGGLRYYSVSASGGSIVADTDTTVALTYDGTTTAGYVDGGLAFSFIATGVGYLDILSAFTLVEDDSATGQVEASAGSIDYLQVYDGVLSASEVSALVAPVSVSAVPLPAGGLLLLSGLAGVAGLKRRKKRTA